MTMVGQVTPLWPADSYSGATAPFFDTSVSGVRYTGKSQFNSSGCTRFSVTQTSTRCVERTQRIQYRALSYASLDFSTQTWSTYATSATALVAPIEATPSLKRFQEQDWAASEGALP